MTYCLNGYDPISDETVVTFEIPGDLSQRCLEIVGADYDGKCDYTLSNLTLAVLKRVLMKNGFVVDEELEYSIGLL